MVSISIMMPKAATNLDVEIEGTFGRVLIMLNLKLNVHVEAVLY